jgi:hypothetical protein
LWVTNSRIKKKVLKGQWQSYAMDGILESPNDNNFGTIAIDKMEQNGFQPIRRGWF